MEYHKLPKEQKSHANINCIYECYYGSQTCSHKTLLQPLIDWLCWLCSLSLTETVNSHSSSSDVCFLYSIRGKSSTAGCLIKQLQKTPKMMTIKYSPFTPDSHTQCVAVCAVYNSYNRHYQSFCVCF